MEYKPMQQVLSSAPLVWFRLSAYTPSIVPFTFASLSNKVMEFWERKPDHIDLNQSTMRLN